MGKKRKKKDQQADETFFRAFVMGVVIVVIVWAGFRYTSVPRAAIQHVIAWYENRSVETDGQASTKNESQQAHAPELIPVDASDSSPVAPSFGSGPAQDGTSSLMVSMGQSNVHLAGHSVAAGDPDRVGGAAAPGIDRRAAIEAQLAELGVVYCLLESFGRDDRRYRFHCDVGLAGAPDVTRSFEAVGRDPIEVMQQVLADVEKWRGPVAPPGW
jgi:hypothetical protein